MLKSRGEQSDVWDVRVVLDQGSPAVAVFEPSDLFSRVLRDVLTGLSSDPWLVVLVALLALNVAVCAVRAVIHGGHRPDPQRTFSKTERAVILSRAGHRCEEYSWLLGRCPATESLEADHVHPHSRGGATVVGNGQALCRRHNTQKSVRIPWNWELTRLARRRQGYFPSGTSTTVTRHRVPVGPAVGS